MATNPDGFKPYYEEESRLIDKSDIMNSNVLTGRSFNSGILTTSILRYITHKP